MTKTLSFRHFETELRLSIDKNTNIPKVGVDESIYLLLLNVQKREFLKYWRLRKSAGICCLLKVVWMKLKQSPCNILNSRLAKKQ